MLRCRKKMKRVERRGTLESQQLAPAATHPIISHHHPSMALQASNSTPPPSSASAIHRSSSGRGSSLSISHTLARSDTVLIDQPGGAGSSRGMSGMNSTHLISPYARPERERERENERPRERERERDRERQRVDLNKDTTDQQTPYWVHVDLDWHYWECLPASVSSRVPR